MKSLSEVAEVFLDREADLGFDFGEIPRSDTSMRARNLRAGYPLD